jgi:hypothetical protein
MKNLVLIVAFGLVVAFTSLPLQGITKLIARRLAARGMLRPKLLLKQILALASASVCCMTA